MPRVIDYLPEFVEALKTDLLKGEDKYGDTWLERDRSNQVNRIFDTHESYYDNWLDRGGDFPWVSVAGNAMIAWIRDNYPELSESWEEDPDLDTY